MSMLQAATEVRENAWVPYSRFKVGAAVRGVSGTIYRGCNVENAAYPEGTCAGAGAIAAMVAAGRRSVQVYLVMRGDCQRFSVAADIDPAYAQAMAQATAAGLEVLVLACRVDAGAIEVDHRAGPQAAA